jgi:hypothetical protein
MPATNLLLHHTMLATDAWTWAEIFHIVAQRFLVYKYAHRIKNVNFINFGKTENRAHILCQLRILRNLKALIQDAAAWRRGLGGGGGENGVGRRQGELARHLIGELARQDADGRRCVLAGYESPSASWGARTTKARRWVLAVRGGFSRGGRSQPEMPRAATRSSARSPCRRRDAPTQTVSAPYAVAALQMERRHGDGLLQRWRLFMELLGMAVVAAVNV